MKLYDAVRVVKLLRPLPEYDGWGVNKRAPKVGDIGTYIDLLQAPNLPDHFVVESVESDGSPIWLSEFLFEEIEGVK